MVAMTSALVAMVACSDEPEGAGSSSSSSGAVSSSSGGENTSSSSGSSVTCNEPSVDPNCNATRCTEQAGEPAVCRNGACVKLASEDCKISDVFGAFDDDRALWIGGTLAMVQGNGKINTSGPPRRNAMQLAIDEINDFGGVPAGEGCAPRKLAAIVCDDGSQTNTAGTTDATERIGNHLVGELGVKALVGAGVSGSTINMTEKVVAPQQALMIAPSATAIAINTLAAAGGGSTGQPRLLWRTAPSDDLQSKALIAIYNQILHAGETTRLAIVNKSDAFGVGLADAFQRDVKLNGANVVVDDDTDGMQRGPNFVRATCDPQSSGEPAPCDGVIEALTALKPTVIVLLGTAESTTRTLKFYEATNPNPKPFYLAPDAPAKPELWAAVKANPELATRVRGVVPGRVTPLASNFFDRYRIKFPQAPDSDGNLVASTLLFGMAGSYDATYLLTYAMLASGTDKTTFTGPELAVGMSKTVSGALVSVGTADFGPAVTSLQKGESINVNGASGALDFDLSTGTAPSDIIVWCVRKNPSTNDYERFDTAQYFTAAGQLEGDFSCDP